MSRTVFAAAALLVSCNVACAEISKSRLAATRPLRAAYEACVVGHAKSLAGSAASTESIIKGALRACQAESRAVSEALRRAGLNPTERDEFLHLLDEQVSRAAAEAVLAERDAH